jgi:hypothetical protein
MIHPIFMAAMRHPELIVKHLANYFELVRAETLAIGGSVARRVAGAVVALVAILLALGLSAIAVMLGVLHGAFHWVLVIVPGTAWLLAAAGIFMAARPTLTNEVQDVRDQVEADMRMLRLVKDAKDE